MGKALLLAALLSAACAPESERAAARESAPATARVSVGVHGIEAELAEDLEARARGLSGRDSLAPGHGMLFVFGRPDRYGFWMKDMRFDIDMVWIRDGRIVDITHRVSRVPPADGALPVYRPAEPAEKVLEVPAGTAERLGWELGDPVRVERQAAGGLRGPGTSRGRGAPSG